MSTYLEYIEKEFIKIDSEIAIKNSRGHFDINKIVEDTFMHIINVTYGWSLKNANLIQEDFPSVDLVDDKNKIVIQVTSTTNTTKVNSTVKKFRKLSEYSDYKLKMFYIKHQANFSRQMLDKFELEGIEEKDLLNISKIFNEISADTKKAVQVYEKLQEIVLPSQSSMKEDLYITSKEKFYLPKNFKIILDRTDSKFNRIINEVVSHYDNILNVGKLDFFPNSNDFGIKYINNILKIQDKLITEQSLNLLSEEDITTLVVATIGHDITIHLSYEGFQTLISSSKQHSKKWNERWNKFVQVAKKYNESKLKEFFNSTQPIISIPKNKEDWSKREYLLVGEFIRSNHSELVEDILNYGFPTLNGTFLDLSSSLNQEKKILEFSKLLAKSHGMKLRDTFDEIGKIGNRGNLLAPYKIHIVYLMVILRITDYLDIYENRHLKVILGLKTFMNDISKFEWDKDTYVDIQTHWDDVEAVFVSVEPQNSNFFIKLKSLFQSMQYELDLSWAVLGEVYSKDSILKDFSIKYRRIKSTLDNEEEFREKVNYVPKKISFDSDPELLKLLIAPLYGNNPSYGVRELLQNAVDACKEKKELGNDNNYEPIVNISLLKENDKYFFEIVDNGLGMLEDTIINYFLKAGASFRNSDFWMENLKDEDNQVKVTRTGRFGVGLLAVFLLGNKITVKTKYHKSNEGYEFTTHLADSQINIVKNTKLDIGTSIKIELDFNRYKKLVNSWVNWYILDDIKFVFSLSSKISKREVIDESTYIKIKQNDYTYVKWSFDKEKKCMVNGFIIPNAEIILNTNIDVTRLGEIKGWRGNINTPSLLISDKEGVFPLTLSRNELLHSELSFNNILIESMVDNLFKKLITYKVEKNKFNELFFSTPMLDSVQMIFNKDGFNIFNSFLIEKNKLNRILFIELNSKDITDDDKIFLTNLLKRNVTFILYMDRGHSDSYGYSKLFEHFNTASISLDKDVMIESANIIIPEDKYRKLFTYQNSYLKVKLKDNIITSNKSLKQSKKSIPFDEESHKFIRNYYKKKRESVINLEKLDKFENIGLILEIFIDYNNLKDRDNIEYYFYNLMDNYFQNQESFWIPYIK